MRRRTTLAAVVAAASLLLVDAPAVPADPGERPVTARFSQQPEVLGTFDFVNAGGESDPGSAVVNGRMVFAAAGAEGEEVWITDGTPQGTRLLADVNPGPGSSAPTNFVTFGGLVWFAADQPGSGEEWWVTDGTPAGTRLFADLATGASGTRPDFPVVVGDHLFFEGWTAESGRELMVTDGAAAGTRVVADALPGPQSGFAYEPTPFGSRLVYGARVAEGVYKPFVTDGRQEGTSRLDAEAVNVNIGPHEITVVGDRAFFAGGDVGEGAGVELWSSRGLSGDARPVKDIEGGVGSSFPNDLVAYAGRLHFVAYQTGSGHELWTSDGTVGRTRLLREIGPPGDVRAPSDLVVAGRSLHLGADDGVHGHEPWVSDGSTVGTRLVLDLQPGAASSTPGPLAVIDGSYLFRAFTSRGWEPWITDGTAAGTRLVADLAPGADSSNPRAIGVLGKTLIFATEPVVDGPVTLHAVTVPTSATTVHRRKKPYSHRAAKRRRIVLRVKVSATTPLSGTVTLTRKGRVVGTAQVRDGRARVRVTKRLKAGKHRILVTYSGSVDAQPSSTRTVVKVRPKPRKG